MGIIKQGILGGFSGKVGPVIGSSWKGIDYMKGVPTSVANPQTAPQMAQRGKFSNAVDFAKEILAGTIKPLRDRFAVKMSGYNAFMQDNISLFESAMPTPASNLIIASGKMEKTEISSVSSVAESPDYVVEWTDDSGQGYKTATDKAYIVAFNEDTGEIASASAVGVRSDETATVSFDIGFNPGMTIHIYLVFLREDGTVVSNTAYKTVVSA